MLTQKMMFLHPKLMRVLTDFANIDQVFHCAFLKVDTERIQQKVSQCFLEICKKLDRDLSNVLTADSAEENKNASAAAQVQAQQRLAESIGAELPSVFFFRLFWNQYLGQALLLRSDTGVTKELFNFVTKLMQETELASHLEGIVQPEEFVSGVTTMIQQRPILEAGSSVAREDVVLSGIFNVLKAMLRKRPQLRASFPEKEELLLYLLHDCLFHKETSQSLVLRDSNMPPKCKSKNTRYACLSLVKELAIEN